MATPAVAASDAAATEDAAAAAVEYEAAAERPWRVLEFFAGIGGMRVALSLSGANAEVAAAYEISEVCEKAYLHNFPQQQRGSGAGRELRRSTIERLTDGELDAVAADVWLMSPPCQPFTRSGRQRDAEDNRTCALLHLLEVLRRMQHPPRRILLENVIGFERSESRRRLLETLAELNWDVAELDLRPEDFGLPNSRPRYYGLFRAPPAADAAAEGAEGADEPSACVRWRPARAVLEEETVELQRCVPVERRGTPCPALGDFLLPAPEIAALEAEMGASLELPLATMEAHVASGGRYDLHLRTDSTSACLTKGYGRFPRGYGPLVLVDAAEEQGVEQRPKLSSSASVEPGEEGSCSATYNVWREGSRLRYLACREQLRLMGYPEWYAFPQKMTLRERFSLIGNSLNVRVVAWLIRGLLPVSGQ